MTPSQSQSVLEQKINNLRNTWFEEQKEGFELIKNRDRPSKLKTLYQQILQLDDKVQKLVNKNVETLRDPDISFKHKVETEKYFQYLNAEWLPYINGEKTMTDQQNQTVQLTSDVEPTAARNSQSVVGDSQRTVENGNPNKDNDSKASSNKRVKKAEKLAALEKNFAAKMRLKKNEFELKKKELEIEMQLFEKEGALKLEYEKEALDALDNLINWKTPKNKDVSGWLDNSDKFSKLHDYSFEHAKTRIDNNYPRVSFNREGLLKSRSPSGERASAAWEQDKFKRNKPGSSSQVPTLNFFQRKHPRVAGVVECVQSNGSPSRYTRLRENEPLENFVDRKSKVSYIRNGLFGRVLRSSVGTPGTEVLATLSNCRRSA